ncbi:RagB/SusD family nutrient uptake outer membrane protein [Pinibacter soli]|uniref:RagB/SusD family nutrient uptake outer membrane protein n=1 Tax=Pinibacter soli TaxID=3044211 RepID=A0ABT6REP3_9BACT|nr:RagB/SusD family nutrient uptake outer membrane protein [Pinibacter soli]MDI3320941.1 RagB/SusD family nutrient uptake outer membrane protein [Pinibacter soli]
MKIRNIFFASGFALTALAGCAKSLNIDPTMQQTADNFYRNETDAFQALTSAYSVLTYDAPSTAGGSAQNVAFSLVSEVMGDYCYGGGANATDIPATVRLDQFQEFVTDPGPEALWSKYFTGLKRSNILLDKLPNIPFEHPDLKPQYEAEAKFLRAYYYFDLVRLFGNVPLLLRQYTAADGAQKQVAPEEIYKQIGIDLRDAINAKLTDGTTDALPKSAIVIAAESKGRVSKAAAQALLMRVWLYYTGYYGKPQLPGVTTQDIIAIGNDVINNSGNDLMPNAYDKTNVTAGTKRGVTPLFDVANKNNVESVFEVQYSALSKWGDWGNREGCMGNQAVILWGMRDISGTYAAGWSFAPVSKKLFDKFDPKDPRRFATLINANASTVTGDDGEALKYTKGYQNTGYFCRKFAPITYNNAAGGSRELNYPNDNPVIRFADVLLMAAELNLNYGDKNAALTYYKRVRERAMGVGSVTTTASQLTQTMIDDERVFELSLEGVRYWDVLRKGQDYAASVLNNGEAGDFSVKYNKQRAGLLPIPQYEITQSNGVFIQNPGY